VCLSTQRSSGFRSRITVLLAAAIVAGAAAGSARAGEWGPWSAGGGFPALLSPGEAERPAESAAVAPPEGAASLPLIALIRLYRAWLSPVYGDRCPMVPSCSRYAIDAIGKHGPVLGVVMASGRLMHEADERTFAPIRKSGDRYLFFDPVENNDFWFAPR